MFLLLLFSSCNSSFEKAEIKNNVVSSAHPLATKSGMAMYQMGGNAFDAAVASAFTLAVVEPSMSGIGGRLQTIYRKEDGKIGGVDASTEVPVNYVPLKEKFSYGYETIGIPGVVAGLIKLQKEHGLLDLYTVMQPAISHAENGFMILPGEVYRHELVLDKLQEFEITSENFLNPDGSVLKANTLFIQKNLATTLKVISAQGSKGFYEGEIAEKMVQDIQSHGGILTLEDLKNYKALDAEVVEGVFRGHKVYALYLPSFGAITVQILQILDQIKAPLFENDWAVTMGKATRYAYQFRNAQKYPDSLKMILSYKNAGKFAWEIDSKNQTIASVESSQIPESWKAPDGHTTHLTTADSSGNVVSLTQTVGPIMGSKVVSKDLGFIYAVTLGGYLGDYKPGDRANSHITPTLLTKNGKVVLALGAAGGSRIVPAVVQVISRYVDQSISLEKALMLPRVYPVGDTLWVENHPKISEINADLDPVQYPHKMIDEIARFGRVHAIAIDSLKTSWLGAADPDWEGTSESFVED
tara:strand:+ start:21934 stop:23511 length:1578 start_codon:yes stop_codon:yes gene_type:complete